MRLPLAMQHRLSELEAHSAKLHAQRAQHHAALLFAVFERATAIAINGGTDVDPRVMIMAESLKEMRAPAREEQRRQQQQLSEELQRRSREKATSNDPPPAS